MGRWVGVGSTLHILGGSWVVISGHISRVTILITHIRGLITPLITTHEPPSTPLKEARSPIMCSTAFFVGGPYELPTRYP